jgi:L-cystine transport system substrate-binding protein
LTEARIEIRIKEEKKIMKKIGNVWIGTAVLAVFFALAFFAGTSESAEVKKVVVAVASGNKPLSYADDDGNLLGYETDALKLIDELIPEYAFDLQSVEDDAQQIGLDAGKYALIAEGLFKTPERLEKYILPEENIGVSLIKIVIRGNETNISSLDDLVGRKVAPCSPNGGIFNLLTSYNNTHERKITIETREGFSAADSFSAVASGKYDAVVRPSLGFDEIKEKLGLDIKQTAPVKVNNTYFVLAKSQADLASRVNEAIKILKRDGKLSELSKKYFGEDILQYKEL